MVGLRASPLEEILGSDYFVHNIIHKGIGVEEAVEFLSGYEEEITSCPDPAGVNLGHVLYLQTHFKDKLGEWKDSKPREMTRRASFAWKDDSDVLDLVGVDEDQVRSLARNIRSSKAPRKSEGGGAFGGKIGD